jgi:hypothetical protein
MVGKVVGKGIAEGAGIVGFRKWEGIGKGI